MPTDSQGVGGDKTSITTPQELENAPLGQPPVVEAPDSTSIAGSRPEPIGNSDSMEACRNFAVESHNYVQEYIKTADQKAAFFFAASTALVAFLYQVGSLQRWLSNPINWGLFEVLSFLATVGLSISALYCLWVVFPRLKGSMRGLVFFAAIAEYESSREYVADVLRKGGQELTESLLSHTHELAKVCKRKYQILRLGFWSGTIGIVATLILFILGI